MPVPPPDTFALLGVVHLLPLPAAPRGSPGFAAVRARAVHDADTLAIGGMSGFIIENFGDAPFCGGEVDPHVVAGMAVITAELRERHPDRLIGVNVLRNDARAALAVAAVCGADFVRINVLAGAAVTDQGIVQGNAHAWLRYRRELAGGGPGPFLAADVHVKHAVPLAPQPIEQSAEELHHRAGAEVVVITGRATGSPACTAEADVVRTAVPGARVWVGSGVTAANAVEWRRRVHGAIVGTVLHEAGDLARPLDGACVREVVSAFARA